MRLVAEALIAFVCLTRRLHRLRAGGSGPGP
jgi:hypothetical protein